MREEEQKAASGFKVQTIPSPKVCPIISGPGPAELPVGHYVFVNCQGEECQAWEPQFGDCSLLIPGKLAGIEVARTESRA